MRFRAMSAPAEDTNSPPHRAFAGDDEAQLRWFGDNGGLGLQPFAQLVDPQKRRLFVHDGREPHLAPRRDAAPFKESNGMHHGRQPSLGVAGASTIEASLRHGR